MPHPRSLLSLLDFSPPPPSPPPMHPHKTGGSNTLNPSILIIVLILALVVLVSASIHLILRFLNRFCTSPSSTSSSTQPLDHPLFDRHVSSEQQALIDSLPLFSFDSVVTAFQKSAPDCAVCLSRFEPHDQLRLLPACCHAFHSRCIDTWLASNLTCPLCRSTIQVEKSQSSAGEESFRLEIGSVSQRREPPGSVSRRSYSMGSFEYVVDDDVEAQVVVGPTGHSRDISDTKDVTLPPGADVAEAVGGRGWLKEYVDRLASSASSSFSSSRALSFRLSGRGSGGDDGGATGSSRRSDGVSVTAGLSWDMDRAGEEGGHFFRWLMGA